MLISLKKILAEGQNLLQNIRDNVGTFPQFTYVLTCKFRALKSFNSRYIEEYNR